MNSKFAASLLAAASLVSVNAFAAGADGGVDTPAFNTASTLTRAQVQAEARGAQAAPVTASSQVDGGTAFVAAAPAAGTRTRSDVRSEAVQARGDARFGTAPGRA